MDTNKHESAFETSEQGASATSFGSAAECARPRAQQLAYFKSVCGPHIAAPEDRRTPQLRRASIYRVSRRGDSTESGAVLLEVILALVLFVAAATIIGSALNTSATGVERLRLSVHAANLATSVLAELQIGSRTAGDGSPEPFAPPFDTWMWEVTTLPIEEAPQSSAITGVATQTSFSGPGASLVRVEVVVRDTDSDFVYRLSQIVPADSIRTSSERSGTQLF